MQSQSRKLASWVAAGLITQDQMQAIDSFERQSEEQPDRRLSIAEALGYIGAALAFGATGLVIRGVWQQLVPLGRIGLALASVLIFGSSAYLTDTRPSETFQRLTTVLTAVASFSLVAAAVLALDEYTDWSSERRILATAVVYALSIGFAYSRRQRPLLTLLLFSSGLALLASLLAQTGSDVNLFAAAMLFWGYAVCWVLLAIGGWVIPRRHALIVGSVGSVIALQIARASDYPVAALMLGIVTAAALVVFAMRIYDQILLAIAALTVFIFVPQLVFLIFEDSLGAAGALFVSGLVLVLLAVLSSRARRKTGSDLFEPMHAERSDDVSGD